RCKFETDSIISVIDCYYDSLVHIPSELWMLFETKKDSAGYLPYTNNLSVFNNTSQPLFCQILGLEADPKYEIKIISIKDTVFNTGAFSLARPEFSFSTSLLPFSTLQKGYGKVKIRIQSKSIDSVFLVP